VGRGLPTLDLVLFFIFYVFTGLGSIVGYHRCFAHRSFGTVQPVRMALAVPGAMTLRGPLTQWVTDQRQHHALADAAGDPHSPHLSGDGFAGAVKGLCHADVGWLFSTKGMDRGDARRRDLHEGRALPVVDRLYLVWVALSVGLPFVIGYAFTGSVVRDLEALDWAGLIRILAFEHVRFAVNSVCHIFGSRWYNVRDESPNNWVVARSTSPGWSAGCWRLGAASTVRLPTPAQIARVGKIQPVGAT